MFGRSLPQCSRWSLRPVFGMLIGHERDRFHPTQPGAHVGCRHDLAGRRRAREADAADSRVAERIVWNMRRLLDGARILQVPVLATEQYPQGLGGTVPELAATAGPRFRARWPLAAWLLGESRSRLDAEERSEGAVGRHRSPRLHPADGARPAGGRPSRVRGGRRRRCSLSDRLRNRTCGGWSRPAPR